VSRRKAIAAAMPEPEPSPVYVVVCPVRVRGHQCKWRSPDFGHDPKLINRTRALGMWREHFKTEHTPVPQVVCIENPEAPHV
jgi:hypothetical protein